MEKDKQQERADCHQHHPFSHSVARSFIDLEV
jgi:hypothetical protein